MPEAIIHPGKLNIIKEASTLGEVTVGVMTDAAIASYKRLPYMGYEQLATVVAQLKGVAKVIPQEQLDYFPNLKMLKPDFVVHGTDWRTGVQAKASDEIVSFMKRFRVEVSADKPIVVVSSTYAQVTEAELAKIDVNIVIYANQFLRAACPAMKVCAERILSCQRAQEASVEFCMPIKEISLI